MSKPFVIFSLPRSRSTWLSKFLSYDGVVCHHDKSLEFADLNDIGELLKPNVGLADTAIALLWREVRAQCADAKFVVVRRTRVEVEQSLAKMGLRSNPRALFALDQALNEIEQLDSVLRVSFISLHSVSVCKTVFEYCLDRKFDWNWWASLAKQNILPDMDTELRRIDKHRENFERVYGPAIARL